MFYIGDVHAQWESYLDWIEIFEDRSSIQVGDFGMGFNDDIPDKWATPHKFIRGNHDNPAVCTPHPNYLGEYGVMSEDGIFFVGGAHSIDLERRKLEEWFGLAPTQWWEDEEIAELKFEKILELYEFTKPKIVVSHDCPSEIRDLIIDGRAYRNRTSDGLLSAMFRAHQPELWVFGHYHKSFDFIINKTRFKGLATLEVFEYE